MDTVFTSEGHTDCSGSYGNHVGRLGLSNDRQYFFYLHPGLRALYSLQVSDFITIIRRCPRN